MSALTIQQDGLAKPASQFPAGMRSCYSLVCGCLWLLCLFASHPAVAQDGMLDETPFGIRPPGLTPSGITTSPRGLTPPGLTSSAPNISANQIIAPGLPQNFVFPSAPAKPGELDVRIGGTLSSLIEPGYQSLVFVARSPTGAVTADENLTLRLTDIERLSSAGNELQIDIPFTIAQGNASVTVKRMLPKWTLGRAIKIQVLRNGQPQDRYNKTFQLGTQNRSMGARSIAFYVDALSNERTINLLVVDAQPVKDHPDLELLIERARTIPENQTSYEDAYATITSASLASMPTDWRVLEQHDAILVRRSTFAALKKSNPQQADCLRQWTLMGGILGVMNDQDLAAEDSDSNGLNKLNSVVPGGGKLLSLLELQSYQRLDPDDSQQLLTVAADRFRAALIRSVATRQTMDLYTEASTQPNFNATRWTSIQVTNSYLDVISPTRKTLEASELNKKPGQIQNWRDELRVLFGNHLKVYPAGMGMVVDLPTDQFPKNWLIPGLRAFGSDQNSPLLRRGVDPAAGTAGFGKWLIPGIAEPPVYTFMAIMICFAIVVGPVSYRWTRKVHRAYLMFLIAPVLAFGTTIAMFTYSFMADGIGSRARLRQLTWIDGASGDAVERNRMTLYSGISARSGVQFDEGVTVMPFDRLGPLLYQSNETPPKIRVTLDGQSQAFSSQTLPARAQTQFVTHLARPQLGTLALTDFTDSKRLQTLSDNNERPFSAADGSMDARLDIEKANLTQLTSELPFKINRLIVRDRNGIYGIAEDVEAGSPAKVTFLIDRSARYQLSKLFRDFPLQARVNYANERSGSKTDLMQQISNEILQSSIRSSISLGRTSKQEGLLENWLNLHAFTLNALPPGTFLGVAEVDPEVLPISGAKLEASVRFVMGTFE